MLTNQLATKYAKAIYELAAEKNMLDQVEQELKLIESTMNAYSDLSTLIYHPRVLVKAKKETVSKIFSTEIADFVLKFLMLLLDKRRETALPAIICEYIKLANEARNIVEAEVTTAVPLDSNQQIALSNKLRLVTGKTVVLKAQIDKSIIGGVVVKIGDKLIDGSVARQLELFKNALLNTEVTGNEVTDCI
jgi:F-type H+-transporting ATPase subunit delta